MADLFDMQDEIIARVANTLGTEIVAAEAWRAGRTPNPDALDFYFQGIASYHKGISTEFTGQVVATNPAHSVLGPKHVVKTGKTTVLTGEQARELLDSIDTSTVVGLRNRALISVMTFAFARIGAAVAMRVEDYYPKGKRWWVRLHEKGGKRHEMPAHHNLKRTLMPTSRPPASATTARVPCSARPPAAPTRRRISR